MGATMQVKLRNGAVLKAEVPHPPGSLQNPASDEMLMKKFLTLCEGKGSKQEAERAAEVILSVDKISNLRELFSALPQKRVV